ncbi:hypothetical protein QE371_004797 [Klebsiella variicola]|nr:hypothetical protein [Klebsiella variicola]
MQNQVKTSAASDQKNHAPDITTGSENMPAPIIVPPIITTPPNRDGRVVVVVSVAIYRNLQSKKLSHSGCDALYQYTSTKGIKKAPIMAIGAVLFTLR